ncbi:MAG: hypothetical protein AAGU07_08030 [Methanobacterium sp.]
MRKTCQNSLNFDASKNYIFAVQEIIDFLQRRKLWIFDSCGFSNPKIKNFGGPQNSD